MAYQHSFIKYKIVLVKMFLSSLLRTFKPKIESLQKAGFRGPMLCQLLHGSPEIMKLSKNQLERRWKFLHVVVGASLEEVAATPQVLLLQVRGYCYSRKVVPFLDK